MVEILKHSGSNCYKIRKPSTGQDYELYEIPTNQVVWTNFNLTELKRMLKRLNAWGGFAGFTPKFFLQRMPVKP